MIIYRVKSLKVSVTLFPLRFLSMPYCGKNLKDDPIFCFIVLSDFYGVTGDAGDVLLMFSLIIP